MSGPTYYAVVNDLIGGYDVSIHNKTVGNHGEDEWTIGSFMSQEGAEEVAHALNAVQAIADAWNEAGSSFPSSLSDPPARGRENLRIYWPKLAAVIEDVLTKEHGEDYCDDKDCCDKFDEENNDG